MSGAHPRPASVLLVCSGGGHLYQLHALHQAWQGYPRVWVTLDRDDARSLLRDETVVFAHGPTTRNLRNLLRNLVLAWRLVRSSRPSVVVTTGAGLAVPFVWVGKLWGARISFIESLARIEGPSLSCRLVAPLVDAMYVQWPELLDKLPRARYAGNVLEGS
jgi:UDP-N-acetylglucosamine:LPS N-acetylglucosamine transferase